MAEKAVHFSVTSQSKPSIFEIIAQDSLAATLHPALKRWVEFLASINPHYLGKVAVWYDEIYLCLNILIEHYYIKNHGGSFAESFYGLRRICMKKSKVQNELADLGITKQYLSLFCLTLLPYIYRKANQRLDEKILISHQTKDNTNLKTLSYVLNITKITWKSLCLIQLIAYASSNTVYHSPLLRFCKIAIIYGSPNAASLGWTWSDVWHNKISITTIMGMGVLRFLEVGAFFMQFLQSWTAENSKLGFTTLPIPTPPNLDSRAEKYKGKCPICLQVWRTPTVLQVSGYIFCYKCISTFLKNNANCPVTQYPATVDDLFRIYFNND